MCTFFKHPEGTVEQFYEIPINIPPDGVVWDYMTGKWVTTEVHSISEIAEDQYWEKTKPENWYSKLRKIEKRKQKTNPLYSDSILDEYRTQEWFRRINGFWFMNNGVPTFITGAHYLYLEHWKIDAPITHYRDSDRHFFYMWKYCEDDPDSFGLIEAARRRSGKALTLDTLIPTPKGFVSMEDLEEGDEVFGSEGEPIRVSYKSPIHYDRDLFEVEFNDGSKLKADGDHQWEVTTKKDRKKYGAVNTPKKVVTTYDMIESGVRVGKEFNFQMDIPKAIKYEEKELPIDPYLFGCWLGDGGTTNSIITNVDEPILEAFRDKYELTQTKHDKISYYIKGIRGDLKNLGFMGEDYISKSGKKGRSKGAIKRIPEIYKTASVSQRMELLKGLMDTDGCVSGNSFELTISNNPELGQDYAELIRSLGIRTTLSENDSFLYDKYCGIRYRLYIQTDEIIFKLQRKINKIKKLNRFQNTHKVRRVVSINQIDSVPTQCIEVDSERSVYLASRDYILTHNTYRSTVVMFEYISRVFSPDNFGGIQSKTKPDAAKIFGKMITGFKALPDFFIPIYDTAGGTRPKNKLTFLPKSNRAASYEEPEFVLGGEINFESYEILSYDGTKQVRYLRDECFGDDVELLDHHGNPVSVVNISIGDKLMGDDGTPRTVLHTNEGEDVMYRINPKKGRSWTCNGPHKLLVSWRMRDRKFLRQYSFGEIFEISVEDYLKCSNNQRRHLMMHQAGFVNFHINESLPIDPYIMGAWIGDGSSTRGEIYGEDDEVFDAVLDKYPNAYISENNEGCRSVRIRSGFTIILKKLNLYNNKHIPSSYMLSSRKSRLALLAGLLDTDGSVIKTNGNVVGYEITQKKEIISKGIHRLCRDLGFYSTLNSRISKMKRDDGTIYKCKTFRVFLFGNLEEIPIKIHRKKPITNEKKKTHNVFSFSVDKLGVDTFYSIKTEGNQRLRNSDGVIVKNCGKTELCDIYEGWGVVKECLKVGSRTIVGKALYTTTIEEGGSKPFKLLWDRSDFREKDPETFRTRTGLYRTFTAAYKNDFDFIDIYGVCDEEAAMTAMKKERAALASSPRDLAAYIRKNPFTIEEAFFTINDNCIYDSLLINQQAELLSFKPDSDWFTRGNFHWKNGIGSEVEFRENFNGLWKIDNLFLELMADGERHLTNRWQLLNDRYKPLVDNIAITGADTFDHRLKNLSDEKSASNAAFYTYWRHDPMNNALSNRFVCEYIHRQPTAALMAEDLLKQCVFFGTPAIIENNKPGAIDFFHDNGYKDFIIQVDKRDGISGTTKNKQSMAEMTEFFIANYIDNCIFTDLLMDWNNFSLEDSTAFDSAMGSGWALLIAERIGKKFKETPDHLKQAQYNKSNASSVFRKYL